MMHNIKTPRRIILRRATHHDYVLVSTNLDFSFVHGDGLRRAEDKSDQVGMSVDRLF
jgi:hypothetical protein